MFKKRKLDTGVNQNSIQVEQKEYLTPPNKDGLLGMGVSKNVYVVACTNKLLYALKIPDHSEYNFSPDSMESETTLYSKEIDIQKEVQVKSNFIMNLIGVVNFVDRRGFIFEYCSFGNLKSVLSSLRSKNKDISPYLTCRIFKQVTEAVKYLHEKDADSKRWTHNDINPRNIYLNESMQVRLGNFGVSTKAVRTESNSRSTEAAPRAIRYANYFLSERRHKDKQAAPRTKDDLFALGASIYATLVAADTASQKFYSVCEKEFPMRLPVWRKIVRMAEEVGEKSKECFLVYKLLKVVETCCLGNGVESASKKNGEESKLIESVSSEFDVLSEVNNFDMFASKGAKEVKEIILPKQFEPDSTWVPISDLLK